MLEPGVAAFCYIHGVPTLEVMQGLWAVKMNPLQFTARYAIHKMSFFSFYRLCQGRGKLDEFEKNTNSIYHF